MRSQPPPARGGSLSVPEFAAWAGLLRTHAVLVRALDAELQREHRLTLSAFEVLLFLAGAPRARLRLSELAASVNLTQSGLTRLIDRMAAAELVRRAPAPDDGRGSFAVLTHGGVARLRAARATHIAGVRRLFLAHLSPVQLEQLATVWECVLPGFQGQQRPRPNAGAAPGSRLARATDDER